MFVLSYFLIFVKIIAQKKRFVRQTDKSLFSAWIYIYKRQKLYRFHGFYHSVLKYHRFPKFIYNRKRLIHHSRKCK